MTFDDRLATVIAQPVETERDRAVRWRQLVDLLSHSELRGDEVLLDQAYHLAATDLISIDADIRAAAARQYATAHTPARLVALFATDDAAIAAPMLAAANLGPRGWELVASRASNSVINFLSAMGHRVDPRPFQSPPPRFAAPAAAAAAEVAPRPLAEAEPPPTISDAIARIEALRRQRERERPVPLAPAAEPGPAQPEPRPPWVEPQAVASGLPNAAPVAPETVDPATRPARTAASAGSSPAPGAAVAIFQWEAGTTGRIEWIEGAPRGALIGRSLADERHQGAIRAALANREPFADSLLVERDGPLAGEWQWSGAPAFNRGEGRFIGYRGIARRTPTAEPIAAAGAIAPLLDADALRELIHEIRTPLNAIIGFAEIIDGQYLGPAQRRYRERAAEIVGQARQLLAALGDLDFAALLQSDRTERGDGVDLAQLLPGVLADLALPLAVAPPVVAAIDPALADRLVRRFVYSIITARGPGEPMAVEVRRDAGACALRITRPAMLAEVPDPQLFDPGFTSHEGEVIGIGFALRLVRGLARMAGGDLVVEPGHFNLTIPARREP